MHRTGRARQRQRPRAATIAGGALLIAALFAPSAVSRLDAQTTEPRPAAAPDAAPAATPAPAPAASAPEASATGVSASEAGAQTPPAAASGASGPIGSRAESIVREQAARVAHLKPYEPNKAERLILAAEASLTNPPPVYVWFGSLYPGGLIAAGAGYRKPYGDTGLFDVHGGWSVKNYKGATALFRLPELAHRRVRVDLKAELLDAPSVGFWGLGDVRDAEESTFAYRPTTLGATVTINALKRVAFGGGVDYVGIRTGAGGDRDSIEQRFTPQTAPGLGGDPDYLRTQLFAGYDWRVAPGYTDRGGWYHAEWYDYRRRDDGPGSFRRLDAEARQFIPLLRANWVIALRGLVSVTDVDTADGELVPYYLMPSLGSADELRGYPAWRFRDRHRILTSAEYRWKAGQFVDMALFVDAGKVTAQRKDLDFSGLITSYGIGVRFHTPTSNVLRIELARTRDGFGLVFSAGQIF